MFLLLTIVNIPDFVVHLTEYYSASPSYSSSSCSSSFAVEAAAVPTTNPLLGALARDLIKRFRL